MLSLYKDELSDLPQYLLILWIWTKVRSLKLPHIGSDERKWMNFATTVYGNCLISSFVQL
jgi:hypothetical protein